MSKVEPDMNVPAQGAEKHYLKPDLRKGPKLEKVTAAAVGSPKAD